MSFDALREDEDRDKGRAKRLAGSYVAALVVLTAFLGVGIAFGGQIRKQVFEEEVDVKFVPPEPVKAAPAPPPPPPPPPKVAKAAPPKGEKRDAPPTELPSGPPAEGDPNHAKEEVVVGEANGCVGCTGTPAKAVTAKPVEAPRPPPAPPVQVAEVSTPPIPIHKAMPAYPEDARKQGVEAIVVVKFIVNELGRVEEPRVMKGHPLFDELVLAAVRTWTFQPATIDGQAVRMVRMVKIPFHLRHT